MADPGNLKRPLYAPKSGYKQSSPGDDIIAVKRAISRAGWWKWQEFSDDYTNGFAFGDANGGGVWGFQKKRGISPSGNYGEKTHQALRNAKVPPDGQHPGEPAFDQYAADLYRGYVDTSGDPEKRVRDKIVEFCERGLKNPQCWNYAQIRPIDVAVAPDSGEIYTDCSGSAIQAFHFAKRETGIAVPDPAKQNWSGYGNTDYYQWDHPKVTSGEYKVGDLAHYDGHVTLCIKAGSWDGSDWWSFGSEPPSRRKLSYRSDFLKVVRPPLK